MAFDVSYDISGWEELIGYLRKKYMGMTVMGYGHIGDGNVHINFCSTDQQAEGEIDVEEIYQMVAERRGSISAEHGVGTYKRDYLHLQKDKHILERGKQLKDIFDPHGILNPYKVIG